MQLEDIVVSLDLAKELKENEYPQESIFVWYKDELWNKDAAEGVKDLEGNNDQVLAAPTASEIGEQIKNHKHVPDGSPGSQYDHIFPEWHDSKWQIQVKRKDHFLPYRGRYDTEAEARGHAWLYLKRNNLLKETANA